MHRYAVPPVPFPNNDEQAGKAFALPAAFESEAPRAVGSESAVAAVVRQASIWTRWSRRQGDPFTKSCGAL